MKTHFLKLFDYDQHANLLILESLQKVNAADKTVQLMAHLLVTPQVWLQRCKGLTIPASTTAWPDWNADRFPSLIKENYLAYTDFVKQLNPEDFDRIISYQNSKGAYFQNQLSDILTHMINHGTHHRAQIGQQLKLAGLPELPATDYIFYLRENGL